MAYIQYNIGWRRFGDSEGWCVVASRVKGKEEVLSLWPDRTTAKAEAAKLSNKSDKTNNIAA